MYYVIKTSSMTKINIWVFTSPNFIDLCCFLGSKVVKNVSHRETNIVIRIVSWSNCIVAALIIILCTNSQTRLCKTGLWKPCWTLMPAIIAIRSHFWTLISAKGVVLSKSKTIKHLSFTNPLYYIVDLSTCCFDTSSLSKILTLTCKFRRNHDGAWGSGVPAFPVPRLTGKTTKTPERPKNNMETIYISNCAFHYNFITESGHYGIKI